MTDDKPTRRDLMKPVQLLGLAFVAAVFAGVVSLVSMGAFQARPADEVQRALVVGAVAAGVTFIVVLVSVALLLLAVDPAQVAKQVDRPLLLPPEEQAPDAAHPDAQTPDAAHPDAQTPDAARPDDSPETPRT
jgi:hypothetical protein